MAALSPGGHVSFVCSQEMRVEELTAVRQTLQADLETSIRRIVDLQAALEEVESSDESDTERYRTVAGGWAALEFRD